MSNIDKRALRVLATALDGDDWHAEGNSVYGGRYDVGDNVCYDHIASCESVNAESPHADFIAAANPATVLALLDELEDAEKRIAEFPGQKRLIGWRMADYTDETADPALAKNWATAVDVLPIFEGDVNTKLSAAAAGKGEAS
ncbi:TPA: ead/Ea22-like family protein [Enterobacter hormaechei]